MFWQITAAIAATLGLLFAIFVRTYPHLQRYRRRKQLLRIAEIKGQFIKLGNKYRKVKITEEELGEFKKDLKTYRGELLSELSKISKKEAKKYEHLGFVDLDKYKGVENPEHKEGLAICVKWIETAEKILDKYL